MKFSYQSFFRWSKATAAQINDRFTRLVSWSTSSLSTDSLLPMAVDTRHHHEPLTIVLNDEVAEIKAIARPNPVCTVYWSPSSGNHKIALFGFIWYRRMDGAGTTPHNDTRTYITWYDSNGAGAWDTTYTGCRPQEDGAYGKDQDLAMELDGSGWAVNTLRFEYGGGACIATSLYKSSSEVGWPLSAPATVERFGLFGGEGSGNVDGKAQLWAFIEDDAS